jgi:lysophospholipase L1-like esterase
MRAAVALLAALLAAAPALAEPSGTIVAFGDSITKGLVRPLWPDVLRARLQERFPHAQFTIVNAGIGGNRLLDGVPGLMRSGVARFGDDALGPKDVRIVILLEGMNDLGGLGIARAKHQPDPPMRGGAAALIRGYTRLITAAHARGVRIYGGTLTPFKGATLPGYYSAEGEAVRQKVNRWIRTAGAFDSVIDFDAAICDPADPAQLRPDYDSGDHVHPSAAGETAMAQAIDLALLE